LVPTLLTIVILTKPVSANIAGTTQCRLSVEVDGRNALFKRLVLSLQHVAPEFRLLVEQPHAITVRSCQWPLCRIPVTILTHFPPNTLSVSN
jgi:hypothetical protein